MNPLALAYEEAVRVILFVIADKEIRPSFLEVCLSIHLGGSEACKEDLDSLKCILLHLAPIRFSGKRLIKIDDSKIFDILNPI